MKQRYIQYASQIQPSETWKSRVEDEMLSRLAHKKIKYSFRRRRTMKIGIAISAAVLSLAFVLPWALPQREDVTTQSLASAQPTETIAPTPSAAPQLQTARFADVTMLHHEYGYRTSKIRATEDSFLYFGGIKTDDDAPTVPTIERYDSNFNLSWIYQGTAQNESYSNAIEIDGMVIAIRTEGLENSVIEHIKDGELIYESGALANSGYDLFPASDGYFAVFYPAGEPCSIEKYDLSGSCVCSIRIEDAFRVRSIDCLENGYRIVGSMGTHGGFVMLFDSEGNKMSEAYSENPCEVVDAITAGEESFALGCDSESGAPAFVEAYRGADRMWTAELAVSDQYIGVPLGQSISECFGELWSMTTINTVNLSTVVIHRVTKDGDLIETIAFEIPGMTLYDAKCVTFGEKTYCILTGNIVSGSVWFEDEAFGSYTPCDSWTTIVKEVTMNS